MQQQAKKIAGYGFLLFVGMLFVILGASGKVGAGLATAFAPQAIVPTPPNDANAAVGGGGGGGPV
jgi:hypothetical protein